MKDAIRPARPTESDLAHLFERVQQLFGVECLLYDVGGGLDPEVTRAMEDCVEALDAYWRGAQ